MTAQARAHAGGPSVGQAGFALLIVLWTLVLLALLVTQLTAAGQGEAHLAANLRAAAQAEAAADGAVFEATFRLMDASRQRWVADGAPRDLRVGAVVVRVRVLSELGKLNPNLAPVPVLAALLQGVGASANAAPSVAAAIADWRSPAAAPSVGGAKVPQYRAAGRLYGPPGEPFETLDELGNVLGMTPDLLARLRPHLSLYQETTPNPAYADPLVLAALGAGATASGSAPAPAADAASANVVTIIADALTAGGARFIRRAVLRIGVLGNGSLYRVLDWDSLDAPVAAGS